MKQSFIFFRIFAKEFTGMFGFDSEVGGFVSTSRVVCQPR